MGGDLTKDLVIALWAYALAENASHIERNAHARHGAGARSVYRVNLRLQHAVSPSDGMARFQAWASQAFEYRGFSALA
jgi:hypothetical protein